MFYRISKTSLSGKTQRKPPTAPGEENAKLNQKTNQRNGACYKNRPAYNNHIKDQ